ncbi:MAG: hypothetical protein SOW25_01365 [Helicobacter sp.]|nr:hypothetical protein [Helicobacteraceae bacterium]MDY3112960.1 hypothetical protein [Helicobacter sp.]
MRESKATEAIHIVDLQVWANRYREARHALTASSLAMTKDG